MYHIQELQHFTRQSLQLPTKLCLAFKPSENREVSQNKDTEVYSEVCSQEPEPLNISQVLQVEHYEQTFNEECRRK